MSSNPSNCCFSYSFSLILTNLGTRDLCASIYAQNFGPDFRNFDVNMFDDFFLNFNFGLTEQSSPTGLFLYSNNTILFANVQNRKQQKKLVVKKHNDRLPEKQKCSFKLANHSLLSVTIINN